MKPEQQLRLRELIALVQRLVVTLEDAPNCLNPLAQEPTEAERIRCWDRDVVLKVKSALLDLLSAKSDTGWSIGKQARQGVDFFIRFPSIYNDLFFAQWSLKEKEIDQLMDEVFAVADSLR